MSVLSRFKRLGRARIIAIVILSSYAILALITDLGIGVAGQGLDQAWAGAQARGRLRVAVDYGFRPFTDIQQDQPFGYDIDLARAIAGKLGLEAEFVPSGLDSIYDDLASGKADIAASALPYAPEQGWRVAFSEFYFNAGQVLVVPNDATIATIDDLRGRRVGVTLGSDGDTLARNLDPALQIELVNRYEDLGQAFADLQAGQLDAVITDNLSALIGFNSATDLRIATALTFEPYAIAMPVQAFRLRSEVNRAIAELQREGFFAQNGATWFR
ncbi:MAG: ABC transporter substrate-binding protein [Roseiflexaceae bacterium]